MSRMILQIMKVIRFLSLCNKNSFSKIILSCGVSCLLMHLYVDFGQADFDICLITSTWTFTTSIPNYELLLNAAIISFHWSYNYQIIAMAIPRQIIQLHFHGTSFDMIMICTWRVFDMNTIDQNTQRDLYCQAQGNHIYVPDLEKQDYLDRML